jgi:phosphoglucosamine mutase
MKRLFGTDGIRGEAGRYPLDPPTVRRFGAALSDVLLDRHGGSCRVVLGRDTRESGPRLRDAVASGLLARGAEVIDAGVISTPGLASLVGSRRFQAGVMISASHNLFQDNGLKVFGPDGLKLSDALEHKVEERVLDETLADPQAVRGAPAVDATLARDYIDWLLRLLRQPDRLRGMRLLLDCANGATSELAPEVFRRYGAEVLVRGAEPDGRNINLGCGSLHVERLAQTMRDGAFDLGLAFDGDGDRALAIDRRGRVVDGDHILYLAARRLQRNGQLRGHAVVGTILSNLWLEQRLAQEGLALLRAAVGDKYVLERMIADDLALGGEQSGHVIFRDHLPTGDGVLTGLMLIESLLEERQPLEEILDGIVPYPQVQLSVPVRHKPDLLQHPRIGAAAVEVQRALADSGRVVLRYSGTEPVARVMVEGREASEVQRHAAYLVGVIARELGA